MEGVIPNSKLVIIPSPQGEKSGWKRELFLRPGAWIPWVTLTVVLSTVIFALVVFVLHLNEKVRTTPFFGTLLTVFEEGRRTRKTQGVTSYQLRCPMSIGLYCIDLNACTTVPYDLLLSTHVESSPSPFKCSTLFSTSNFFRCNCTPCAAGPHNERG